MTKDVQPYGHAAIVEVRTADGFKTKAVRRIGPRRAVERAARLTSCFVRIVEVEEYPTKESYEAVFGVDRRRTW